MKTKYLLISIHLFIAVSLSQTDDDARTTFKRTDIKLNQIYQELLLSRRSDTVFTNNLRTSERLWIKFRDAQLSLKYPTHPSIDSWDSLTINQAAYLKRLTEDRVKALLELLPKPIAGLVAHYTFDHYAFDQSRHGNSGRVFGATPTKDRFGNANSAYDFDGTESYIEIPNSTSLNLINAISLSAWIMPKEREFYPAIINKGNVGNYQESFALYLTSDNRLAFLVNVNATREGRGQVESRRALPLNTWTHVAGTYDGVTMYIYINGNQVAQETIHGRIFSLPVPLLIGKSDRESSASPSSFFKGAIDDVEIFDHALSAEEILKVYNTDGGETK